MGTSPGTRRSTGHRTHPRPISTSNGLTWTWSAVNRLHPTPTAGRNILLALKRGRYPSFVSMVSRTMVIPSLHLFTVIRRMDILRCPRDMNSNTRMRGRRVISWVRSVMSSMIDWKLRNRIDPRITLLIDLVQGVHYIEDCKSIMGYNTAHTKFLKVYFD